MTQNLFEGDYSNIYEFTPGGVQTTFASGLSPMGLAFNSAGVLFELDINSNIYEFTPGGVQTTFASGLNPIGLAFDRVGNLFVADWPNMNIHVARESGAPYSSIVASRRSSARARTVS
ncbi:MAG TPA: hypothetical protein VMJ12_04460 [Candidatus Acidoferrales bacterium]|nr:hypothetical protein [Candidatus Acidoferrales bacterium]